MSNTNQTDERLIIQAIYGFLERSTIEWKEREAADQVQKYLADKYMEAEERLMQAMKVEDKEVKSENEEITEE